MDMSQRPIYESWRKNDWQELFQMVVARTVIKDEQVGDIVEGAWSLARRRAEVIGREFEPGLDVPYGLSLFCWWPLKYKALADSWSYLSARRWALFQGASYDLEGVERRLSNVVPDDVLKLDQHQLLGLIRVVHIRHILNFGEDSDSVPQETSLSSRWS